MLAKALRDEGRVRLFGARTAGCVATVASLARSDGSVLRSATKRVVSRRRAAPNKVGVQPDEVTGTDPSGADPDIAAALVWLAAPR